MSKATTRTPAPRPEHALLEAFIGRWTTYGRTIGGEGDAAVAFSGTDCYEWLPGGFFVVRHVDIVAGDVPMQSIEVFGYDEASGTYIVHAFNSQGVATSCRATVCDGVWTFQNETERFTCRFSADGNVLSGIWARSADGIAWVPAVEVTTTRMAVGRDLESAATPSPTPRELSH